MKRIIAFILSTIFMMSASNIVMADTTTWNNGAKINYEPAYAGQSTYRLLSWFEENVYNYDFKAYEDLSQAEIRWNIFAGPLRVVNASLKEQGSNTLSNNGGVLTNFEDGSSLVPEAQTEAKTMVSLGVLEGRERNSKTYMDMADSITRAEVAKIYAMYYQKLGLGENMTTRSYINFEDVRGHWSEPYVRYCYEHNIINGRSDIVFDPEAKITKEEAIKMLLNMESDSSSGINISNIAKAINETYCVTTMYTDETNYNNTTNYNGSISTTAITPDNYSISLAVGQITSIKVKFNNSRRLNIKNMNDCVSTSTSTTNGVATISVRGVSMGTGLIQCSYNDSYGYDYETLYIPVFVRNTNNYYYSNPTINIDDSSISLSTGERYYLSQHVSITGGTNYMGTNYYNEVYYSSSNPEVASVGFNSGEIIARSKGSCYIYVITNGQTKKVRVNVSGNGSYYYDNNTSSTLYFTTQPSSSIRVNSTINLKNYVKNLTGNTLNYSTSNSYVATVNSSGVVTGKNIGNAVIYITAGTQRLTYNLYVYSNNSYDYGYGYGYNYGYGYSDITGFSLQMTSCTLSIGETLYLDDYINVYPYNADMSELRYVSDNKEVATVGKKTGEIEAKSTGRATIEVYVNGNTRISRYFYVYVNGNSYVTPLPTSTPTSTSPPSSTKVLVSDILLDTNAVEMYKGQTYDLKNIITLKPTNASDTTLTFVSSNTNVATVGLNSGIISAHNIGQTDITITASSGVSKSVHLNIMEEGSLPTQTPQERQTYLSFSIPNVDLNVGATFNPYSILSGDLDGVTFTLSNTHAKMVGVNVVAQSAGYVELIATNKYGNVARLTFNIY